MKTLVVRVVGLLIVSCTLVSLFFHPTGQYRQAARKSGASAALRESSNKDDSTKRQSCSQPPCSSQYKVGKKVIYQPLLNCFEPEFLSNYTNPCWTPASPGVKIACAARVMLLGFHKCGTSDMEQWFYRHNQTESTNTDYFYDKGFSVRCPFHWLEKHQYGKRMIYENHNLVAYDSCPGCVVVNRVIKEHSNYITLQSAVQFLQYTMLDTSRYIVTMRKPSDRMISHFFYILQEGDNPYAAYSREQVGYDFFHNLVSNTIKSLTDCLVQYGTTVCVLAPTLSPITHSNQYVTNMIAQACYSTYLKEVFKFIPKDLIYFSKLEEYSADEKRMMRKILRFVGLSDTAVKKAEKLKNSAKNALKMSKPVHASTETLLETFYRPFNTELSEMLEDEKWLWQD